MLTTPMVTSHMQLWIKGLLWKDILKLCDLFRGIANCKLGYGSNVFSGQTFGMTMSCRASFQDFSLLPKTRRFLCCGSFQTTTSSHNSTFLCPNKNIKECNTTFNLYRFNKIQKTLGTIFGKATAIHILTTTT